MGEEVHESFGKPKHVEESEQLSVTLPGGKSITFPLTKHVPIQDGSQLDVTEFFEHSFLTEYRREYHPSRGDTSSDW
jgi:hypothetical protein